VLAGKIQKNIFCFAPVTFHFEPTSNGDCISETLEVSDICTDACLNFSEFLESLVIAMTL
jgi:hypothetical protein